MRWKLRTLVVLLSCLMNIANAGQESAPKISIIIDDLGNNQYWDYKVAQLPGPVVCSILPYTFYSYPVAHLCHSYSKEIILHTPMQAIVHHALGPGGLTVNLSQSQFETVLTKDIQQIPFLSGINNHMGSLLTEKPMQMEWVMQVIKPQGLFYIDSRTSGGSVAEQVARNAGVPTASRDVFLDDVRTTAAVRGQFEILLADARKNGSAIAIGHPYAPTITYLEQEIPQLEAEGYQLVPVSDLLHHSVEMNTHPVAVSPIVTNQEPQQQQQILKPKIVIAIQPHEKPVVTPEIVALPSEVFIESPPKKQPTQNLPVINPPQLSVKLSAPIVVASNPPSILWREVIATKVEDLSKLWLQNVLSMEISADLLEIKLLNSTKLLIVNLDSEMNQLSQKIIVKQQAAMELASNINSDAQQEIAALPNPTFNPAELTFRLDEIQKNLAVNISRNIPLPRSAQLLQKNMNVIVEPYIPTPVVNAVTHKSIPQNIVMKVKRVPTTNFPLELSHITPLESFLLDVLQYKLCPQSMQSCKMWY